MNTELIAKLDAEIKAKQELKEIALAVYAGAEWEVRYRVGQDCWHKAHYELEWYLTEHRAPIWQVRLKPKPVMRPWSKPEDVPALCWLTQKDPGTQIPTYHLVNLVCRNGVYVNNGGVNQLWKWSKVVRENRYSTDRINWKPCETTEEAK